MYVAAFSLNVVKSANAFEQLALQAVIRDHLL